MVSAFLKLKLNQPKMIPSFGLAADLYSDNIYWVLREKG